MDSERGRGGRKKYSLMMEDKLMKRLVILTKAKDGDKSKGDEPVVPTIILKTREGESRAISPKPASKDGAPSYQIAPRVSTPDYASLLQTPPQMKSSVRLLDANSLIISDSLTEYLTESSDFLVIGCIGRQWVGKSTIMSHLVRPPSRIKKPSSAPSASSLLADLRKLHIDAGEKPPSKQSDKVFRTMTEDNLLLGSHTTEGVQAYINEDRVIFLDCQPVQSMSVLVRICNDGSVRNIRDDCDYMGSENEEEILSLQLAAFILSVSHVVLLIQDTPCDPEFMRFILSAEMLKPISSVHQEDEENNDYFPQIMVVHNKAKDEDFSKEKVKLFQETYKKMFASSNFQLQTRMGIANGNIMATLNPTVCEFEPVNFYLLPVFSDHQTPLGEPRVKVCQVVSEVTWATTI